MKKIIATIVFAFLGVALLVTCKKDYSLESGNVTTNSTGTLLDSVGSCQNIGVFGTYTKDSTLTDSNYIAVQVNFSSTGKYVIASDTVAGFWFIDSGHVFTTGLQTIKVKGYGQPLLLLNPTFVVNYNNTSCFFVVPISGSGGTTTPAFATYTLAGAPDSCTGAAVQGTYTSGQLLTEANTATVQIIVTSPGGYSISTPVTNNGIDFKQNGIFPGIGTYAVTLYGSGTPIDSGTTVIPLSAGSSICFFPLKVK